VTPGAYQGTATKSQQQQLRAITTKSVSAAQVKAAGAAKQTGTGTGTGGGTGGSGGSGGSSGGGGGSGGGSGGSGGSSGSSGGASSSSSFQLPSLIPPKPAWYHGLWPPNSAAATVRDGWFALLGDLSGYPYNATIVQGVTVQVQFGPPTQLQMGVRITGPDGVQLVNELASQVTATALGLATEYQPVSINVTVEYSVIVFGFLPPSKYATLGPSWIISQQTVLGKDLHKGISVAAQIPSVATSGSLKITAEDSSGNVLSGHAVSLIVLDVNQSGGGPPLLEASGTTDSSGNITFSGPADFFLADTLVAYWTLDKGQSDATEGSIEFSGQEYASGATLTIQQSAPGGAPSGTASTLSITATLGGSPVEGATVTIDLSLPTETIYEARGTTDSSGHVGFPIPTSISSQATVFQLDVAVSKPGSGNQPLITGSDTQPNVQASAIVAGTYVDSVACYTE